MIRTLIVEDNDRLRQALKRGLDASGKVQSVHDCASGEAALEYCLSCALQDSPVLPEAALMDVQLAGAMNGIQAAVALRREFPRFPLVFYSIQDEDVYYRDFRRSGILSHYAYVRKSNYLLPEMILPLLQQAVEGHSFIDPDIEQRLDQVRHQDENDPMSLLEPNEQVVARMLAQGLTNEQIAMKLGFRDKRTISRTNGQIYATWGLSQSSTDEKIARTRAALIVQARQLIIWDEDGLAYTTDARGKLQPYPV
jgi:DNA-binding NarL/FixJ family response regulator